VPSDILNPVAVNAEPEIAIRPDRSAVADWTLSQIHELIFNGQLAPGDVLTEIELTQRLGVSRSPVRDALKELENIGLVDVDAVNGRRVLRAFSARDVLESYDLRIELESMAARYAAQYATDLVLSTLVARYEALVNAFLAPVDTWLPIDFEFHAAIAAASGAHRLPHILSGVLIQHQAFLRRLDRSGVDTSSREQRLETLATHEPILKAIQSRDVRASDQAMRDFLVGRRDVIHGKYLEMGLGRTTEPEHASPSRGRGR